MNEGCTTAVLQRYLYALAEDASAGPIVRTLLDRAVGRLEMVSASALYNSFRPRAWLAGI
jgi:hypothetical protein